MKNQGYHGYKVWYSGKEGDYQLYALCPSCRKESPVAYLSSGLNGHLPITQCRECNYKL